MNPDDKQLLGLLLLILGSALIIALLGYEFLLYLEKPVGTLDNVVTFITGTLAGAITGGTGAAVYVSGRTASTIAELEAELTARRAGTPPPYDPTTFPDPPGAHP